MKHKIITPEYLAEQTLSQHIAGAIKACGDGTAKTKNLSLITDAQTMCSVWQVTHNFKHAEVACAAYNAIKL